MWRYYGKDWDWWEDNLTIPLYDKLAADLAANPPADKILMLVHKVKPGRRTINMAPPPAMMGFPEFEP